MDWLVDRCIIYLSNSESFLWIMHTNLQTIYKKNHGYTIFSLGGIAEHAKQWVRGADSTIRRGAKSTGCLYVECSSPGAWGTFLGTVWSAGTGGGSDKSSGLHQRGLCTGIV